ncbi:MAG: Fur family transcriptional regulator [Desulfobulbaceae bacterium]
MIKNKSNIHEKLAYFKDACRDADLKLTHQRLEIFRELAEATDHPTAETLYKRLKETLPTLSLDTVYRTLATFEEYNLVSRVQTTESHARFEAEGGHHHAICRQCGNITDFEWHDFEKSLLPEQIAKWGEIKNKQVTLHGICAQCARTTSGL